SAQLGPLAGYALVLGTHRVQIGAVAHHLHAVDAALDEDVGETVCGGHHRLGAALPASDVLMDLPLGEHHGPSAGSAQQARVRGGGDLGGDRAGRADMGDQVRPGIAALHHQGDVQACAQDPSHHQGGDGGGGGDHDGGPVLGAGEARQQPAQRVPGGDQMVGGAGEDVGPVGKVGGAQHRLPVGATLDVADVVGAALGGSGASA